MIERKPIVDRSEWLSWRKRDVTASTVGALFGVHPYITALRLYAEKRGTEFQDDDNNKVLRRGRWLEPAVAKAVSELRPEWDITAPNVYLRQPDLRLGCTPDFLICDHGRIGVLQCKTVAPSVFERDWLKGNDVPLWVTLQTLTEMMLCDAAFGAVAVLLVDPHNMDCVILDVPRHEGSERKIAQAVQSFWQQVANGIEPDPNFDRDAGVIKALSPRETPGKVLDCTGLNSLPQMLVNRAAYMAIIDDAKAKKEAIETEIKYLMDDAEIMTGVEGWRVTYKVQERKAHTVPASSPRVLLVRDQRAQS